MSDNGAPITVTDAAIRKIAEIRDSDEKTKGSALRLCVRGGGCAGFSYELYFDEKKPNIDQRFTFGEVEILIDSMSLMYLMGTELDYVEGLMGSGFKFTNPNVKSTCGCGSSFSA